MAVRWLIPGAYWGKARRAVILRQAPEGMRDPKCSSRVQVEQSFAKVQCRNPLCAPMSLPMDRRSLDFHL